MNDLGFILLLILVSSPPIILIPILVFRVTITVIQSINLLTAKDLILASLFYFVVLFTSPNWPEVFITIWHDFYVQLSCSGAGCAQNGMGMMFVIFAVWKQLLAVLLLAKFIWPRGIIPGNDNTNIWRKMGIANRLIK